MAGEKKNTHKNTLDQTNRKMVDLNPIISPITLT